MLTNSTVGTANATAVLANYTANLTTGSLDVGTFEQAKRVIIDTVGVLIAASQTPPIRLLVASPRFAHDCDEATIIGHPSRTIATHAAFINGVAGHHIELDDSHSPSQTHPGSVLVPAALAAAEVGLTVSGSDLIAAVVAGYDVIGRFAKATGVQAIYDRGFHPTSVCGTVGCAAAAAHMLRLTPEQTCVAIGLAASQSCGLLTWEDDPSHLAKSFQTGVAARNGVEAAFAAQAGYTGAPDPLAGRYNAMTAFGGNAPDVQTLLSGLGARYEINDTELKRYSSCRQTHAAIDAIIALVDEERLSPADIDSAEVELSRSSRQWVDGNPLWTHNIQYVMTIAAYERAVLPHHFIDRWTTDPDISRLRASISVMGNDDLEAAFPAAKGAIVRVNTSRGTFERQVRYPLGHPDNPMSDEQLTDKFFRLTEPVLTSSRAHALLETLQNLEQLESVTDLCRQLT